MSGEGEGEQREGGMESGCVAVSQSGEETIIHCAVCVGWGRGGGGGRERESVCVASCTIFHQSPQLPPFKFTIRCTKRYGCTTMQYTFFVHVECILHITVHVCALYS